MDIKRQQVEHKKDHRQVLFAMTKIMFDVIALVFERVEGFIFDFPSSPTALNQSCHIIFVNDHISDPTVCIGDFASFCHELILKKIDSLGIWGAV